MKKSLLKATLLAAGLTFSTALVAVDDPEFPGLPWFTGPLITGSANVLGPGHVNFQPYFNYQNTYGSYDANGDKQSQVSTIQWSENFPLQFGFANRFDMTITPNIYTNSKSGRSYTGFADTEAAIGYQVYRSENLFPSIKFTVRMTFPTGKFEDGDPENGGVELIGGGNYASTFALTFGKAYQIQGDHWINFRTRAAYTYGFSTEVSGFNAYGGGYGTKGTVYPGNRFTWTTGLEYSLTKHWALAMDLVYTTSSKTTFTGEVGTTAPITIDNPNPPAATVGSPGGWQWSLAPAIEYNFNQHWGLIGGSWFTFAGKNSSAFVTGTLSLNIYY